MSQSARVKGAQPEQTVETPRARVYLCARYSRNAEMRAYAQDLTEMGCYDVQAEWITGKHDGTADDECARIDYAEVEAADIVISFTEPSGPVQGRGRGGRHVEFGIALALGKRCIVVGHRENVFHHLPQVAFYETWGRALTGLTITDEARAEQTVETVREAELRALVRRIVDRISTTRNFVVHDDGTLDEIAAMAKECGC